MEGAYFGCAGNAKKVKIKRTIAKAVWAPKNTKNWVVTSAMAASPREVFDQWIGYSLVLYVAIGRVGQ